MKLMNEKYASEIEEFEKNFSRFKNKRIVLYGIGRLTATLVNADTAFDFVGLMDKDPGNIGKNLFGLPIIDIKKAEEIADAIIINTQETYWNVIFNRISATSIPVYYKNGQKAQKQKEDYLENPYSDLNIKNLYQEISKSQVVSFDFFDTLFVRTVCNPADVFKILENYIQDEWNIERAYTETRNEIISELGEYYSLDEVYKKMECETELSHEVIQNIKRKEMELEKKILFPRTQILNILKNILKKDLKKDVYIISDMYLPKEFYVNILSEYGIEIKKDHILISNEIHKSKLDGSLWEYYASDIVKEEASLHIGDNLKSDILLPNQYGIHTYHTPSVWDLMLNSSLKEVASHICTEYSSFVMGCVLKKIFNNPYNARENGKIHIDSNVDMGYLVYGPIVLTFLLWLDRQKKENHTQRLLFLARDGYFLKEDYDYLCEILDKQADTEYLGISRQLVMSASITNVKDLMEYLSMPYTGTIQELLEDRLGLKQVEEIPNGAIDDYLKQYNTEIKEHLSNVRNNYLHYLRQFQLDENCAIVDIGFYGNNQRYLIKMLDMNLKGYYFAANLSDKNENANIQEMIPCFQDENDLTADKCMIIQNALYIESVFTAPYGMIKEIDEKGEFICAPSRSNQIFFNDKEEINRGIKKFIYDYINIFGADSISLDTGFIDWYFGYCMKGALTFSDKIKRSYFGDNAMMNRNESKIFY